MTSHPTPSSCNPAVGWATVERGGMPPCDGETVYVGINTAGFACCFNEVTHDGVCSMQGPELSTVQMSGLRYWRALDRPDASGVRVSEAPSKEKVWNALCVLAQHYDGLPHAAQRDAVKRLMEMAREADASVLDASAVSPSQAQSEPDDSSTLRQIHAPDAGPMPSIAEHMSKSELWAYAHLCGYRAAGIQSPAAPVGAEGDYYSEEAADIAESRARASSVLEAQPQPTGFRRVGKADFHMSAEMDVCIGTDLYIRTAGVKGAPLVPCPVCGGEAVHAQDVLARTTIAPVVTECPLCLNDASIGQHGVGRCIVAGAHGVDGNGVGVPATRFGKPYLDGLIDRLLMPLPSMPASDVQKLMGEAAEMIHRLATPIAGVPASDHQTPSAQPQPSEGEGKTNG